MGHDPTAWSPGLCGAARTVTRAHRIRRHQVPLLVSQLLVTLPEKRQMFSHLAWLQAPQHLMALRVWVLYCVRKWHVFVDQYMRSGNILGSFEHVRHV